MNGIVINIDPMALHIGHFMLNWYGIIVILAIIAAVVSAALGRRPAIPQLFINLCRRSIYIHLYAPGKNLVLGLAGSPVDSDSNASDISGDHYKSMEKGQD